MCVSVCVCASLHLQPCFCKAYTHTWMLCVCLCVCVGWGRPGSGCEWYPSYLSPPSESGVCQYPALFACLSDGGAGAVYFLSFFYAGHRAPEGVWCLALSDPYAYSSATTEQLTGALWCLLALWCGFGLIRWWRRLKSGDSCCREDENRGVQFGKEKQSEGKRSHNIEDYGCNTVEGGFACLDSQVEQNNIWADARFRLFIHTHITSVNTTGEETSNVRFVRLVSASKMKEKTKPNISTSWLRHLKYLTSFSCPWFST